MLTGITPFDRPERNELMVRTAQVDEAPAPLSAHLPQAPAVLDLLMARALAKDPALRYGSAIELGETFRSALGLPESAGWSAQQRLADVAKTMSELELPAHVRDALGQRAAEAGSDIVEAFRK